MQVEPSEVIIYFCSNTGIVISKEVGFYKPF